MAYASIYGISEQDSADIAKMLRASGAAEANEPIVMSGNFGAIGNVFAKYLQSRGIAAPFYKKNSGGGVTVNQGEYDKWLADPNNFQNLLQTMYPTGDRNITSSPSGYGLGGSPIAQVPNADAPSSPSQSSSVKRTGGPATPAPSGGQQYYIQGQESSNTGTPAQGGQPSETGGQQYYTQSQDPNDPIVLRFPDGSYITQSGKSVSASDAGGSSQVPPPSNTGTPASGGQQAPSVTGDPNLDALLTRLDKMIQDQAAAGNKFNPNIELTPDVVKQFLDQATAEIEPYYAGQINAVKDQLTTSLTSLQKNYDLNKETQLASFQKNLGQTRENLASGGAAYSGFRGQQEQQLQQGTDRTLTSLGLNVQDSANNALASARRSIGSTGVAGVSLPTFSNYGASLAGEGSFTANRSLDFNNFSAPLTGELQYNQNRDISNLTEFLKQQEIQKRVLSF